MFSRRGGWFCSGVDVPGEAGWTLWPPTTELALSPPTTELALWPPTTELTLWPPTTEHLLAITWAG